MLLRASDLAGAEEAGHANCATVSQRTLAAAVASMAKRKKGHGPQCRNECALIMLHLFVYIILLPRGLLLVLC